MELLTGLGLASAAGLNAYVPLLLLGVLARWTDVVQLPSAWAWLSDPWSLAVIGVLLLVELAADKIPGVDHVNDLLQTVVRPAAGGVVVGAGTGSAALVDDPSSFVASVEWGPVLAGAAVALAVHLLKAGGRGVLNATTAGLAAPVASTAEDALSLGLAVAALLLPVLVLVLLMVLVWAGVGATRRRTRRRQGAGAYRVT